MHNQRLKASITLMIGGAFWGLLWIPLRAIEGVGVEKAWATLVVFAAPGALLIPLALYRWKIIATQLGTFLAVGLFCGVAFSLYGIAVLLTEVNRVILLFYLTPLWGTIIGVIFDLGAKFPWPRNLGDWMAFIAGISWAMGSAVLFRSGGVKAVDQASSFIIGGSVCTLVLLAFAGGALGQVPTPDALVRAVPTGVIVALVIPPVLMMTIWPVTLLTPGRAGILLMTEVIFGIGSAWLLANEVLGLRELIGAGLIMSATVLEVTAKDPNAPQPT